MTRITMVGAALLANCAALAQAPQSGDLPGVFKQEGYITIRPGGSAGNMSYYTTNQNMVVNHGPIMMVKANGEVLIDWQRVESTASDPKTDLQTLAWVRLMLAVRDGTWKPLKP